MVDALTQVIVILAEHDRRPNGGPCRCGWNELGRCHFRHKAEMLQQAGLLKEINRGDFPKVWADQRGEL